MQLVDGGTASGLNELDDRLTALEQIADALDYMHSARHRALRRQTVQRPCAQGLFGGAVLIDFGVAYAVAEDNRFARHAHSMASLPYTGTGNAAWPATVGGHRRIRTGVHDRRIGHGAPPFVADTPADLVGRPPQPARRRSCPARYRLAATGVRLGDAARRWRRIPELRYDVVRRVRRAAQPRAWHARATRPAARAWSRVPDSRSLQQPHEVGDATASRPVATGRCWPPAVAAPTRCRDPPIRRTRCETSCGAARKRCRSG